MPLKAVSQEPFGDGIMSAIDFTLHVEKADDPKGERVKLLRSGKFFPYRKWETCGADPRQQLALCSALGGVVTPLRTAGLSGTAGVEPSSGDARPGRAPRRSPGEARLDLGLQQG